MRLLEIAGERYGRLIALERVGSVACGKQVKTLWSFQCDCGKVVIRKIAHVRKGDTQSCGCYHKEVLSHAKHKLPEGESSRNGFFTHYQRGAAARGYRWNLSRDVFLAITSLPCHYCGVPPSQSYKSNAASNGEHVYNGIDRIDNSEGYIEGNIVPCCYMCNRAKANCTQTEFLEWIRRVYGHTNSK